ncbi:uncharacterized protein VP01_453g17 [Puccinia sorghi]|uniref:Uncharacterized protein n=1 Tax=Puccinia sorghi TaxID=27349 RepID=A0A0L6UQW4_9BASI|nr:uncharacterized protein VP01_453g17 [Puccinia sorghi]
MTESSDSSSKCSTHDDERLCDHQDIQLDSNPEGRPGPTPPILIKHNNPHFDILQLPYGTRTDKNTAKLDASICKMAPGLTRKPTRKPRVSRGIRRTPSTKKCELVMAQLKLLLSVSSPDHQQQEEIPPNANKWALSCPKTDRKQVLMHLNHPKYAGTIIYMLKQEPHPSYMIPRGGNFPSKMMPRGVCLGRTVREVVADEGQLNWGEATKEKGLIVEEVEVTKRSRMASSEEVLNLMTGLSAGHLMNALGESSGLYDALAICSKHLIEHTEAHQALVGMVPKDRLSVWCFWWGFEIALPQESVERLKTAKSIEGAAMQILVALTAAGGAMELLPFIRFIGAYMDMEWGAINEQNQGNGVVIAATWALPMALVPRAWDFDSAVAVLI